jgi:hypothetical protein
VVHSRRPPWLNELVNLGIMPPVFFLMPMPDFLHLGTMALYQVSYRRRPALLPGVPRSRLRVVHDFFGPFR